MGFGSKIGSRVDRFTGEWGFDTGETFFGVIYLYYLTFYWGFKGGVTDLWIILRFCIHFSLTCFQNGSNNTLAERMAPAKARKAVEIFSEQFRMDELTRRRATGDEITVAELSKLASKKWRELSTEQKAKFNNMADKEREKYGDGDDDRKSRRSVKNKDKGEKENRVRKRPFFSFL